VRIFIEVKSSYFGAVVRTVRPGWLGWGLETGRDATREND
jgi:hypothetical protein